jgi:hypothetical protein
MDYLQNLLVQVVAEKEARELAQKEACERERQEDRNGLVRELRRILDANLSPEFIACVEIGYRFNGQVPYVVIQYKSSEILLSLRAGAVDVFSPHLSNERSVYREEFSQLEFIIAEFMIEIDKNFKPYSVKLTVMMTVNAVSYQNAWDVAAKKCEELGMLVEED